MPSRAAFGAGVLAGSPATGLAAEPAAGAAILEQLRAFGALGRAQTNRQWTGWTTRRKRSSAT